MEARGAEETTTTHFAFLGRAEPTSLLSLFPLRQVASLRGRTPVPRRRGMGEAFANVAEDADAAYDDVVDDVVASKPDAAAIFARASRASDSDATPDGAIQSGALRLVFDGLASPGGGKAASSAATSATDPLRWGAVAGTEGAVGEWNDVDDGVVDADAFADAADDFDDFDARGARRADDADALDDALPPPDITETTYDADAPPDADAIDAWTAHATRTQRVDAARGTTATARATRDASKSKRVAPPPRRRGVAPWTRATPQRLNAAARRHPGLTLKQQARLHGEDGFARAVSAIDLAVRTAPPGRKSECFLRSGAAAAGAKGKKHPDADVIRKLSREFDDLVGDDAEDADVASDVATADVSGYADVVSDATETVTRAVQVFNAQFSVGTALLRGGFDDAAVYRFRLAAAAAPKPLASMRLLATAKEDELRGKIDDADAGFIAAERAARSELETELGAPWEDVDDDDLYRKERLARGGRDAIAIANSNSNSTDDGGGDDDEKVHAAKLSSALAAAAAAALSRALAGCARCERSRARRSRAAELFGAAALVSPMDSHLLHELARELTHVGDVAGAEGALRFACSPDPDGFLDASVAAFAARADLLLAAPFELPPPELIADLKRGIAAAFEPLSKSDADVTNCARVTSDGVDGFGRYPDAGNVDFLTEASNACLRLALATLRIPAAADPGVDSYSDPNQNPASGWHASVETCEEAIKAFEMMRWLNTHVRIVQKKHKKEAAALRDDVTKKHRKKLLKANSARTKDLLWRAESGIEFLEKEIKASRARAAKSGGAAGVFVDVRKLFAKLDAKTSPDGEVPARAYMYLSSRRDEDATAEKTHPTSPNSPPPANPGANFVAAIGLDASVASALGDEAASRFRARVKVSARGAVAGALALRANRVVLGHGAFTARDVLAAATRAAAADAPPPHRARGRSNTARAMVANAVAAAATEARDFSAWPLAPVSALEHVVSELFGEGEDAEKEKDDAGPEAMEDADEIAMAREEARALQMLELAHTHAHTIAPARLPLAKPRAAAATALLARTALEASRAEEDGASSSSSSTTTTAKPTWSLGVVDLRLALATLACVVGGDGGAEDALRRAHEVLSTEKRRRNDEGDRTAAAREGGSVDDDDAWGDVGGDDDDVDGDGDDAEATATATARRPRGGAPAAPPAGLIWRGDATRLLRALRVLGDRPLDVANSAATRHQEGGSQDDDDDDEDGDETTAAGAAEEEVRLLPIRPRSRGARRSLRTFPVVTLHPRFPFNA